MKTYQLTVLIFSLILMGGPGVNAQEAEIERYDLSFVEWAELSQSIASGKVAVNGRGRLQPPPEDIPGYRLLDLNIPSDQERRALRERRKFEELQIHLEAIDRFTTEEMGDKNLNPGSYTKDQLRAYWREKLDDKYEYRNLHISAQKARSILRDSDYFRLFSELKHKGLKGIDSRVSSDVQVDDVLIDERSIRITQYFRTVESLLNEEIIRSNIMEAIVYAEVVDVQVLDRHDFGTEITLSVQQYLKEPKHRPSTELVRVRMIANKQIGEDSRLYTTSSVPPRIGDRDIYYLTIMPFSFNKYAQIYMTKADPVWMLYRTEIPEEDGFYEFYSLGGWGDSDYRIGQRDQVEDKIEAIKNILENK